MARTKDSARVVKAYVTSHKVPKKDFKKLVGTVRATFEKLGRTSATKTRIPAVSIEASVLSNRIACLECGRWYKTLKPHIHLTHNMTVEQYRKRWELPFSYPFVAPEYRQKRSLLSRKAALRQKFERNS